MKKLSIFFSILIILALAFTFKPAQAAYGEGQLLRFSSCEYNDAGDAAIGWAQMEVWLTAGPGANQVTFTFYNIGPDASSITDVYFDDGALLGIASILDSDGVAFSQYASPPDLPGGNDCIPPFEVTEGFSADSDPEVQPNGVNATSDGSEWLAITFNLKDPEPGDPPLGFADVISQLLSGQLRIGIHVQGFASGGSEAFINTTETAVELMSFNASSRNGNVNVKWATGTELNNAGFNLYRSSSETGSRTRLNNSLIAARGDAVSGVS